MANHFANLGFELPDAKAFERTLGNLFERSVRVGTSDGAELRRWEDESGATVSFVAVRGALECVTPSFRGRTQQTVRDCRIVTAPDCRYCDPLVGTVVEAEVEAYPVVTQIDDVALARPRIPAQGALSANITGFAEELEVWPDRAAYDAQLPSSVPFAAESFLPVGTFDREHPAPHAVIRGEVEDAAVLTNGFSRLTFQHAVVRTFGATYDLVAPARMEPLARGNIVRATCWMVGRIHDGLTPERRAW